jgi:hypothetical protein
VQTVRKVNRNRTIGADRQRNLQTAVSGIAVCKESKRHLASRIRPDRVGEEPGAAGDTGGSVAARPDASPLAMVQ